MPDRASLAVTRGVRCFRDTAGWLLTACVFVTAAPVSGSPQTATAVRPSPALAPAEVVRIQVEALGSNGAQDEGIALTYRFASPANKRSTGPFDRFVAMVRAAPYDRLLNHREAHYGPVTVSDGQALQMVGIVDRAGMETAYLWILSLQSEGRYADCWMTDAVISADQELKNGTLAHGRSHHPGMQPPTS